MTHEAAGDVASATDGHDMRETDMQYLVTDAAAAARRGSGDQTGVRWTRFDDQTIVWGADLRSAAREASRGADGRSEDVAPSEAEQLALVVQVGRAFQDANPDVPVVLDKGRYLVIDVGRTAPATDDTCWTVRPLVPDTVVLARRPATRRSPTPWVIPLVNAASEASFTTALEHLAGLPTRHSTSQHFDDAAEWASQRLRDVGYDVRRDPVTLPDGTRSSNVLMDQPGVGPEPRDLVVVTAHLDSVNTLGGPSADAPGADDNASGAAALLEIASAFADHSAVHDLRLILFGGEEQGLHGSRQHVAGMSAVDRARTTAVINMDMVGTLNTTEPTVLLEGATVSQALITDLANAAATYTALAVQTSLTPFASDHVPFIDVGVPAVLTIEGADRSNANVHTVSDTVEHIHAPLALDIIRMNVAAAATYLGHDDSGATHATIRRAV
ncbi:MAG TPA: M28 family metallopeptidase [Euzebyales bacterium]